VAEAFTLYLGTGFFRLRLTPSPSAIGIREAGVSSFEAERERCCHTQ
jgi:hypothetical protein